MTNLAHILNERLLIFLSLFTIFSILERFFPLNTAYVFSWSRWSSNIMISIFNSLVVILAPISTVLVAYLAYFESYGFFYWIHWPTWLVYAISILILDVSIYAQHVLFHKVPILWRLHKVHHADIELDASSGIRFHTIEIILSVAFKCGLILALGIPIKAVLIFEVILNGMAVFNHANLKLPSWLENIMRLAVVTPQMHVIHHSQDGDEMNRNFGFNLSIWDRLFGTYLNMSRGGEIVPKIGLKETPQSMTFFQMLLFPFRG